MSEIDSLSPNMYYAGVQNSTNEALKNRKSEKTSSTKKTKFSELIKGDSEEVTFKTAGLPPEISRMTLEEAAVFLKDAVDNAGNALEKEVNKDNIEQFKKSVSQFILFMVQNNFEVTSQKRRKMKIVSPINYFSTYNTKGHLIDPKIQINVINDKLNELTQLTLETQMNNLKILQQVDEIKGLIIDLMSY